MKKKLKKANTGGPMNGGSTKTRTVTKTPDGMYKQTNVQKIGDGKMVNKSTTRRTLKGVIAGVPKSPEFRPYKPAPTPIDNYKPSPKSPPDNINKSPILDNRKKGGSVKKKK